MLKVVFDTNVYISALITPGGNAEKVFFLALEKKIYLFTSIPILTETAKKLTDKFLWDNDHVKSAVKHIGRVATVVKPMKKLNVLNDEPDNRILECAKQAEADLIITGDKHLLVLKEFEGIDVVKIAHFLKKAKGQPSN